MATRTRPGKALQCAGTTQEAQPWRSPARRDRPKPCTRAVEYRVQDADELRPLNYSCRPHLGGLVVAAVARYGPVTVERVKRTEADA